jgi:hypothetical protein
MNKEMERLISEITGLYVIALHLSQDRADRLNEEQLRKLSDIQKKWGDLFGYEP